MSEFSDSQSNKKINSTNSISIKPTDIVPSRKFTQINSSQPPSLFNQTLNLQKDVIDPMSLVASPSRGLDHQLGGSSSSTTELNQLDLTNPNFQSSFFIWLKKRIEAHHEIFLDPLAPNLNRAQNEFVSKSNSTSTSSKTITPEIISQQLQSLGTLIREIRKLREGIISIGRNDLFAIEVYELSAELLLEACEFEQLDKLLHYLIFNLYQLNSDQIELERRMNFIHHFNLRSH
ncbi:hypothetical protein CROQUDRAFT_95288 [Cronartium quercuum f. sp. fusiforme G11]|uniref:Uncharacterized protein n=1 Tax=Cronartium quercuum f. sp. fusiforme G11 TaxID=708437 RepID=A0A9P6TB53_9BASI|nr:hypothetical protein CROQUDRAFT_95288 [Cronartium quercuum f. sp. fusiforme G11]